MNETPTGSPVEPNGVRAKYSFQFVSGLTLTQTKWLKVATEKAESTNQFKVSMSLDRLQRTPTVK
jgi:hypothetical protein